MKQNSRFRHESLQDRKSVKQVLKAVLAGLEKGEISLEDEDGAMVLSPADMVQLKISASRDGAESKLVLRLSWQDVEELPGKKNLMIG